MLPLGKYHALTNFLLSLVSLQIELILYCESLLSQGVFLGNFRLSPGPVVAGTKSSLSKARQGRCVQQSSAQESGAGCVMALAPVQVIDPAPRSVISAVPAWRCRFGASLGREVP